VALRKPLLAVVTIAALSVGGWATWRIVQPTFTAAPAAAAPDTALAQALRRHVDKLAVEFSPRDEANVANLDAAAAYIEAQLRQTGARVSLQPYSVGGRSYRNVIAQFGPETESLVVIGAHYDVAGEQPGADDNASGVAGLIELARRLGQLDLSQRVELVAYTLEEPPHFRSSNMGSAVHAKSLKVQGKRVSLMLSLECIGYFSDAPDSQQLLTPAMKAVYPTTGNFIALVGNYEEGHLSRRVKAGMQAATDLPVYSINAPSFLTGIDFSDHLSYWNEGFVGMMVTDTAFFRNQAYHTPEDTPDRLDYGRMAKVVEGVWQVVRAEAAVSKPKP